MILETRRIDRSNHHITHIMNTRSEHVFCFPNKFCGRSHYGHISWKYTLWGANRSDLPKSWWKLAQNDHTDTPELPGNFDRLHLSLIFKKGFLSVPPERARGSLRFSNFYFRDLPDPTFVFGTSPTWFYCDFLLFVVLKNLLPSNNPNKPN